MVKKARRRKVLEKDEWWFGRGGGEKFKSYCLLGMEKQHHVAERQDSEPCSPGFLWFYSLTSALCKRNARALVDWGPVTGDIVHCCKLLLFFNCNSNSQNLRSFPNGWVASPRCDTLKGELIMSTATFVSLKRLSLGKKVFYLFMLAGLHWMCAVHSCL